MRILLQRVNQASVTVDGAVIGQIKHGLLLYVGITHEDTKQIADWMVEKVAGLRVFPDEADKLNLDVTQVGGSALVISQFTLYGNCMRGKRPDFLEAAAPGQAKQLYDYFISSLKKYLPVESGSFGAYMEVASVNAGPISLVIAK